jgi:hypothetical protein
MSSLLKFFCLTYVLSWASFLAAGAMSSATAGGCPSPPCISLFKCAPRGCKTVSQEPPSCWHLRGANPALHPYELRRREAVWEFTSGRSAAIGELI